ncbi:unnamed protein product, partial [Ostreobium quekettii]
ISATLVALVQERYLSNYLERHMGMVLPLLPAEVRKWQEDNGREMASLAELGYNEESGLCYKACMCVGCPHYLVPSKRLCSHLDPLRKDLRIVKAFHRTIRLRCRSSLVAIRAACVAGEDMIYGRNSCEENFRRHGEWLMAHMEAVRDKYLRIQHQLRGYVSD